jgi:hypothetical protein
MSRGHSRYINISIMENACSKVLTCILTDIKNYGVAWLSMVRRGSDGAAWLSLVQRGSVMVRRGSAHGAA